LLTVTQERKDKIAAVVLAAGMSRRMGRFKPLLPFGDRPLIWRVVESVVASGVVDSTIVVTGHASAEAAGALAGLPVQFAHNPVYESGGMLSSIQTGLRALPPGTGALLVVLGDQPMVSPRTIARLCASWNESRAVVVVPSYHDEHGHPVLLDGSTVADILALAPAETLRTYVKSRKKFTEYVEVDDPAIIADIDTPQDYEQALTCWHKQGTTHV